jgi:hypothetical protein
MSWVGICWYGWSEVSLEIIASELQRSIRRGKIPSGQQHPVREAIHYNLIINCTSPATHCRLHDQLTHSIVRLAKWFLASLAVSARIFIEGLLCMALTTRGVTFSLVADF